MLGGWSAVSPQPALAIAPSADRPGSVRWKASVSGLAPNTSYVLRLRAAAAQPPGGGNGPPAWGKWSAASEAVTTRKKAGDRTTRAWAAGLEWQSVPVDHLTARAEGILGIIGREIDHDPAAPDGGAASAAGASPGLLANIMQWRITRPSVEPAPSAVAAPTVPLRDISGVQAADLRPVAASHDGIEISWRPVSADMADISIGSRFELQYGPRLWPGQWRAVAAPEFAIQISLAARVPQPSESAKLLGAAAAEPDNPRWKASVSGLAPNTSYVLRVRAAAAQPPGDAGPPAWGKWSAASEAVTTRKKAGDRTTRAWAAGLEWQSLEWQSIAGGWELNPIIISRHVQPG